MISSAKPRSAASLPSKDPPSEGAPSLRPAPDRPSGSGRPTRRGVLAGAAAAPLLLACSPTVRVEAPDRPIEINLNVRIQQEVRIRIDRELEQVFDQNPDIFGTAGADGTGAPGSSSPAGTGAGGDTNGGDHAPAR